MSIKILRFLPVLLLAASLSLHAAHKPKPAPPAPAAVDPYSEVQPATETLDLAMYQRIRDEGLNHSHVMEFATALMDGIGPRLSPRHPHHPRSRLPRPSRRGPHGEPPVASPARMRASASPRRLRLS